MITTTATENKHTSKILPALQCPYCGLNEIGQVDEKFRCRSCKKEIPAIEGIMIFDTSSKDIEHWKKYFNDLANSSGDNSKGNAYVFETHFRLVKMMVANSIGKVKNQFILDVGCGNGIMNGWLAKSNYVAGVDISLPSLKLSQEKDIFPILADASALPVENESVDIVLCIEMLQHIRNETDFVNELCRKVKKTGKLIISTLNNDSMLRRTSRFVNRVRKGPEIRTILRNPMGIMNILKTCGFDDFEIGYSYFPFPFSSAKSLPGRPFRYFGTNFIIKATKNG